MSDKKDAPKSDQKTEQKPIPRPSSGEEVTKGIPKPSGGEMKTFELDSEKSMKFTADELTKTTIPNPSGGMPRTANRKRKE